jgi:toxin ParE1/3/4
MRHFIAPLAVKDIEAIGDYIAKDNPRRAHTYITELQDQCAKIATLPHAYRLRPELAENLRSCAFGNYVIFFKNIEREIIIVRVLHGAMDISVQFLESQK